MVFFSIMFYAWLYFFLLMFVLAIAYIILQWRCETHYISDLHERAILWRVAAVYSVIYFVLGVFI